MKCMDVEALLCDYVDGTLPAGQSSEVQRHLSGCPGCAALARDAAAAVQFIEQAAPVEPPPELITKILYALPAARHARKRQPGGIRRLLSNLVRPMLQPRFAMGFAMTVLSFSMLAKFAGIVPRQLTPSDLSPAKVWQVLDDRLHRAWDRTVKFYESLRLVYEIQTRLQERTDQDQPGTTQAEGAEDQPAPASQSPPARSSSGATR